MRCLSTVVVLALLAAWAMPALAQPQQPRTDRPAPPSAEDLAQQNAERIERAVQRAVEELDLTPEQAQALREALTDAQARMDALRQEMRARMEALAEEREARLRDVLTEEQRARLEELMRQAMHPPRQAPTAPETPRVREAMPEMLQEFLQRLDLTDDQRQQLRVVMARGNEAREALMEAARAGRMSRDVFATRLAEVQEAIRSRMMEVLTPEQQRRLAQMLERQADGQDAPGSPPRQPNQPGDRPTPGQRPGMGMERFIEGMELTPEQIAAVRAGMISLLRASWASRMAARRGQMTEADAIERQALAEERVFTAFAETLTPEQVATLRERWEALRNQAPGEDRPDRATPNTPTPDGPQRERPQTDEPRGRFAALDLSDEQRTALMVLTATLREETRELLRMAMETGDTEAARAAIGELEDAYQERVREVLTDEQFAVWERLRGTRGRSLPDDSR